MKKTVFEIKTEIHRDHMTTKANKYTGVTPKSQETSTMLGVS